MSTTTFRGQESDFRYIIRLVAAELLAQLTHGLRQVPTLAGSPGIGKTASLIDLGKRLGFKTVVYQLSAKSPEEFSGIPDFEEAPKDVAERWSTTGIKHAKFTRWSIPELAATVNTLAEQTDENGNKQPVMVIFDDIHMADPALERYLFNLFLDKVVGEYKLADNVVVAAAMNTADSSGFTGFNSAILDRLSVYKVKFDFDYWYTIVGATLHPMIAAFLKHHKDMTDLILGEEAIDSVMPTPRSWTELSTFLKALEDNNIQQRLNIQGRFHADSKPDDNAERFSLILDQNLVATVAKARVGDAAAAKLAEFYVTYTKYNFEHLLKTRQIIKLNAGDQIEQLLYSYILRYAETKEDGKYIVNFIESNLHAASFLSFITYELAMISRAVKKPNPAHAYIHDWFVNSELSNNMLEAFSDVLSLLI